MKLHSLILGAATAVCATGLAFAPRASATVSDEDFNSLKSMVQQLNDSVQSLKQEHNQDQQTIQQLREQLGQTQTLATNAVQTAQAAQAQANKPPSGPFATHNFSMVGDAEVQYGKVDGSHSAFALADFAPIFLYRANDNILFEAGFDVILQNDTSSGHANGSSTSIGLSFAQFELCAVGLHLQRLRDSRGGRYAATAGHLQRAQRGLAHENTRRSPAG
jgi:TolA-binding protein